MKTRKKLGSLVLAIVAVLSLATVPASAGETDAEEGGISPRYLVCEFCFSRIKTTTTYGNWVIIGQRLCEHDNMFGVDIQKERSYVETTECTGCGRGETSTGTERVWECHGTVRPQGDGDVISQRLCEHDNMYGVDIQRTETVWECHGTVHP